MLLLALSTVLLLSTQSSQCEFTIHSFSLDGHLLGQFLPCLNICPGKISDNFTANCTKLSIASCIAVHLADPPKPPPFTAPHDVALIEEKTSITLKWKGSSCKRFTPNYSPAYRVEIKNASSTRNNWFPIGISCSNYWSANWTNDCETLQFRVIALGQCVERVSAYSEIAPMSGLRLPPSMSDVILIGVPNQKPGTFFEIKITWSLKWSKWSAPVQEPFNLVRKKWSCPNDPGKFPYQTLLVKLQYNKDKTKVLASLKVHTSSIGCRFNFEIIARSKCKTTSNVTFKLDLTDCTELVPDPFKQFCTIPPVDSSSIQVSYVAVLAKDKSSPTNTKVVADLFCANWTPATMTLADQVVYHVAWRTSYLNRSAIIKGDYRSYVGAVVYNSIGNKTVSGNSSCSVIECNSCRSSKRLHFQVITHSAKTSEYEFGSDWVCFDTNTGRSQPINATELAAVCPCYLTNHPTIYPPSEVEMSAPVILQRCERITWPPTTIGPTTSSKTSTSTKASGSSTTTTSNDDKTTKSDLFTTTAQTDRIISTTSITGPNVGPDVRTHAPPPISGMIGFEIWVPILVVMLFCAGGVVILYVYVYRSRGREQPQLTMDKLRQVMCEVSASSAILRQQSHLSSQPSNSARAGTDGITVTPLSPTTSLSSGDAWEIISNTLTFTELLGEGAFGKVMKATFSNGDNVDLVVAVKLVPDNAEPGLLEDFLSEIMIMKRMGRHPCLLNMIGCITQSQPVCLVVEFAENGDLLGFLHRQRAILNPDQLTLRDLNYIDLLTFAKQISLGMEFISVRGFVHRDLACRNVLIDGKRNAKIGDFGLARYVYDNAVYFTRVGRALPIRWMPPEALYERKFSSASDVWSFGIILYELVTLGAPPYPGIGTRTLVRELRTGYHMGKPATRNCPDNMFAVMEKCWALNANERPSFSTLVKECNKLLAAWTSTEYVDMAQAALAVYEPPLNDPLQNGEENLSESITDPSLPNFI